jgi:GNAT superfamily N-acetyltransferase
MKQRPELIITPRDSLAGYDRIDIDLPEARIGNVRCRFMGEKVIVYSIQIFPEFQRNGYATVTIDMLKERYEVIVADRVRFTARGFWEKMGFKPLPDGNWEFRRQPH